MSNEKKNSHPDEIALVDSVSKCILEGDRSCNVFVIKSDASDKDSGEGTEDVCNFFFGDVRFILTVFYIGMSILSKQRSLPVNTAVNWFLSMLFDVVKEPRMSKIVRKTLESIYNDPSLVSLLQLELKQGDPTRACRDDSRGPSVPGSGELH